MNIDVRQYMPSDENSWDNFVHSSSNGTIFHLRSFLSYHIDRKFDDHSLIIKKNETIIAVFPAALITNNNKKIQRGKLIHMDGFPLCNGINLNKINSRRS